MDKEVRKANGNELPNGSDDGVAAAGESHEDRAEFHFKMAKAAQAQGKSATKYFEEAKKQAEIALILNDNSWKAHQMTAKMLQESAQFEKALEHFSRALALYPASSPDSDQQLRAEMECCKFLAEYSSEIEDPSGRPLPLITCGRMEIKQIHSLRSSDPSQCQRPGNDDVVKGHQLFLLASQGGLGKYEDAAMCYSRAAEVGSPEGLYSLAILHADGKGVHQDNKCAVELLKAAADLDPTKLSGDEQNQDPVDIGVTAAQNYLGFLYLYGIGVQMDLQKAAEYFQKASDNGCANAMNNIGNFYFSGLGVPINIETAEKYWKMAVDKGNMYAAHSLAVHYLEEFELSLAKEFLDKAIHLGYTKLDEVRAQFHKSLESRVLAKKEAECYITIYELMTGLHQADSGLSFSQRLTRMLRNVGPQIGRKMEELSGKAAMRGLGIFVRAASSWPTGDQKQNGGDQPEVVHLKVRVAQGSIIARQILHTWNKATFFQSLWDKIGEPTDFAGKVNVIEALYLCNPEDDELMYSRMPEGDLAQMVESMLETYGETESDLDRKLRVCYTMLPHKSAPQLAIILEDGMKSYPEEIHFYRKLSHLLCIDLGDYEKAMEVTSKALARFPDHIEFLHYRGMSIYRCPDQERKNCGLGGPDDYKVSLQFFQRFLDLAPEDHPYVPETLYAMGCAHWAHISSNSPNARATENEIREYRKKASITELTMARYLQMAKDAETRQLPHFVPNESDTKTSLEYMVATVRKRDEQWLKTMFDKEMPQLPFSDSKSSPGQEDSLKDVDLIKSHRHLVKKFWQRKQEKKINNVNNFLSSNGGGGENDEAEVELKPSSIRTKPVPLGMTPITLQEMNRTKDQIFRGYFLNLTVVEDPVWSNGDLQDEDDGPVEVIARDENGDCIRLIVYKIPQEEREMVMSFGRKFTLMSPSLLVMSDRKKKSGVYVGDPQRSMVYMGKVSEMCRHCGKPNAKKHCVKCKWALYCSAECQTPDWKEFGHRHICVPRSQ